jgi:hypothetical protein
MLYAITMYIYKLFFATFYLFTKPPPSTNQFSDTYQQRSRGGRILLPPQIYDSFCFFYSRLLSFGRGATDPRQNAASGNADTFFCYYFFFPLSRETQMQSFCLLQGVTGKSTTNGKWLPSIGRKKCLTCFYFSLLSLKTKMILSLMNLFSTILTSIQLDFLRIAYRRIYAFYQWGNQCFWRVTRRRKHLENKIFKFTLLFLRKTPSTQFKKQIIRKIQDNKKNKRDIPWGITFSVPDEWKETCSRFNGTILVTRVKRAGCSLGGEEKRFILI